MDEFVHSDLRRRRSKAERVNKVMTYLVTFVKCLCSLSRQVPAIGAHALERCRSSVRECGLSDKGIRWKVRIVGKSDLGRIGESAAVRANSGVDVCNPLRGMPALTACGHGRRRGGRAISTISSVRDD